MVLFYAEKGIFGRNSVEFYRKLEIPNTLLSQQVSHVFQQFRTVQKEQDPSFSKYTESGTETKFEIDYEIPDNKWVHIVLTIENTDWKVYING